MFWLGELGGEYYIQYLSFVVLILGLIWSILGTEVIKHLFFVFIVIMFFLPFPNFVVQITTSNLKLLSSEFGVQLLRLAGHIVYREGNIIDLGFTKLQVVEACSGLRYVMPLLILSLLVGYFLKLKHWKRVILFLSSILIAVFANAHRIAITGILGARYGLDVIQGFFHDFEGLFIFLVAFAFLLTEVQILKWLSKDKLDHTLMQKPTGLTSQEFSSYQNLSILPILLMILLIGFSCVVHASINFREKVPISRPLDQFPMQIGQWVGQRDYLSKKIIGELDFSDYLLVDYYDHKGHVINFYVAYYETQRKGESIHPPATCLRGGGWTFIKAGPYQIETPGIFGGQITVRYATLQKLNQKQVVFYWFQKGDRILDNVFELKWYVFWDALTQRRTDGALVRVITPVGPAENDAVARERLVKFIKQVLPILTTFLPGGELAREGTS